MPRSLRTPVKNGGWQQYQQLSIWPLKMQNDVRVHLHIERGSEIDHKWSLKTHDEMHSDAMCELTHIELSTCNRIRQDSFNFKPLLFWKKIRGV